MLMAGTAAAAAANGDDGCAERERQTCRCLCLAAGPFSINRPPAAAMTNYRR